MTSTMKINEEPNSDTSLWSGWTSASLLVNLTNLSIKEQISDGIEQKFDRNIIMS